MKKGLLDILKGKFLVGADAAPKNWLFLVFASFLAAMMISSSHQADKRVYEISLLNEEVKGLHSLFVKNRRSLQRLKLESSLKENMVLKDLKPSANPPQKIIVKTEN